MVSDSLKCSVALDSTCRALQGVYRNSIHNKFVCLYRRLLSQTSLPFTEFNSVRVPAELSDLSHRLFTNKFFFPANILHLMIFLFLTQICLFVYFYTVVTSATMIMLREQDVFPKFMDDLMGFFTCAE